MRSCSAAARLSEALREARELAGLSGRSLAARAGISQSAVSRAEGGLDVGAGTLERLARALPTLDVGAVLGRPGEGPPPASARLWRFFDALHGLRARRVTLDVAVDGEGLVRDRLEVRGLTVRHADLADPAVRASVMGGLLIGSPEAVLEVHPRRVAGRRRRHVVRDGTLTHAFELGGSRAAPSLDYVRSEEGPPRRAEEEMEHALPLGRPFARGASFRIDPTARRFVLRIRFAGAPPPAVRIEAWPAGLGMDPDVPLNRWSALYPRAPRWVAVDARGVAELRIDRPFPVTCYGLSWGHDAAERRRLEGSPVVARAGRGLDRGSAVRRAREEEGVSRRELARRLGCSPSSVIALEDGREPRLSLLADCVASLQGLSPHELVDVTAAPGVARPTEAWEALRGLFGAEVQQEVRSCTFQRDGTLRGVFRTEALTWCPVTARDLLIRHGPASLPSTSEWELESLSARVRGTADEPRVRVVRRGASPAVHEYRFHARGDAPVVSLTRRSTVRGQYAMTVRRARAGAYGDDDGRWPVRRPGAEDRIAEALYVGPVTPARRLRVEVRFPRGYWPEEPRARAVSDHLITSEALPDLSPRAHPRGLGLSADPATRTLVLDVERPLVGLSYALSWLIP